jgi:hypothetical protein
VLDEHNQPILDEEGRETPWSWNQLVSGGFVEYVDTEEEETTLIAMTMRDLAMQREAVSSARGRQGEFARGCRWLRVAQLFMWESERRGSRAVTGLRGSEAATLFAMCILCCILLLSFSCFRLLEPVIMPDHRSCLHCPPVCLLSCCTP